jgi:hypothetical protein
MRKKEETQRRNSHINEEVNIKEGINKVGEKHKKEGRNGSIKMKNEENKYARESKEQRNKGGRKKRILIPSRGFILEINL